MLNYNESKIYKIECITGEGQCYVGATTKTYLSQRMQGHRGNYKRFKNKKGTYIKSYDLFDLYGVENCIILLLENVNVNTKDELLAREAHYIKTLDCVNKNIPGQTMKQYYEANKEDILKQQKEYKEANKEDITKYQKEYKLTNKEGITKYQKKYQNEYIKTNKEKLLAYGKQYYHKKKLLKKQLLEDSADEVEVIDI